MTSFAGLSDLVCSAISDFNFYSYIYIRVSIVSHFLGYCAIIKVFIVKYIHNFIGFKCCMQDVLNN